MAHSILSKHSRCLLVLSNDRAMIIRQCASNTLVFTSVVFRHGDRTPDVATLCPKDPYVNDAYHPIGIGQLTNKGKKRSYQLGKLLRKRYRHFLGDAWDFERCKSYTSHYARTQMTLQAVHAGLFPPDISEEVADGLLWQPVDYTVCQQKDDDLIATFQNDEFINKLDEYEMNSVKMQNVLKRKKDLLQYLSNNSGWNVNCSRLLFYLHNSLSTQREWGLTLPKWTETVFPEPLKELSLLYPKLYTSKFEFRKNLIGNLLKTIITISQQKALKSTGRKINLYSGHDFNVTTLLATFGYAKEQHVPYNSYMLFELHYINGVYGMKVYYDDYTTDGPIQLSEGFCEINAFYNQYKDYIY